MLRSQDYNVFCQNNLGMEYESLGSLNIFMQCNKLNSSAFSELPEGYTVRLCKRDEFNTWMHVVAEEQYVNYVADYFQKVYAPYEDEFFNRCLFVCNSDDVPVASCFIWRSYRTVNTVGWFRVLPQYEGKGLGRALLTATLKDAAYPIFLHTQPTSARAIKLYSDFGFALITSEMPGSRKNDLSESLLILQKVMPVEDYAKLQFCNADQSLLTAVESSKISEF